MPSPQELQELQEIEQELRRLQLKTQQLNDRRALLSMLQSFQEDTKIIAPSDGSGKKSELEEIEEELEALSEKEEDLLARETVSKLNGMGVFVLPRLGSEMPDVPPPPPAPAPSVIFDVEMLPPQASQTQCPSCHQFITTEVFTRVGSVAWMVCFMSILFGCVAGCCLLPFCTDTFKDVVHNCPKCRAQIHTNTKL
uniref:LITAF domain-containing protein n=1 Tax=Lepisosteus oculatus TaxID=7918 RepID=W5MLA8_LEPOC